MTTTIIDDLFRYNDWANERLLKLCDGLTDEQLDQPRELGPGSLRATLYHVWMADQLWLERWLGEPWRLLPTETFRSNVEHIANGLRETAAKRRALMDQERTTGWQRIVTYQDQRKNSYSRPLCELLLHVANHGIHHRAQILSYLKSFGRTVPVGLDYLFYRFAYPTVTQSAEATAAMRSAGLEMATAPGNQPIWDRTFIQHYFLYHDWANARLFKLANALNNDLLDQAWHMGVGGIRKTLMHLHDAEAFWLNNWLKDGAPFETSPPDRSLAELQASWQHVGQQRNDFIANLDEVSALRVVSVSFGGPAFKAQILESLIQLCGHGTHHRAQVMNMLRQCGVTIPAFDYVVRLKEVEET